MFVGPISVASTRPLRRLGPADAPALAALERAVWPPALRATEAMVSRRLALGHEMLAAEIDGTLAGAVCYVPTAEVPSDKARLPQTFADFVGLPRSQPVRSIYVYNLAIDPRHRGGNLVWQLLGTLLAEARSLGARWLLGDARCASYAGGTGPDGRAVPANPAFRAALDAWAETGRRPPNKVLLRDPLLQFYSTILGCRFLHLAPDFFPGDAASGGFHIICVKDLAERRGLLI